MQALLGGAPGAPGVPGVGNLATRNLQRGRSMGLPPGQSLAKAMGIEPLDPQRIATGKDGAVAAQLNFHVETPLWYYVLKEAELEGKGEHLGPVGSRIVAEVFVGLLQMDASSFLSRKPNWKPLLGGRTDRNTYAKLYDGRLDWEDRYTAFTMADLLDFVGELNPIG